MREAAMEKSMDKTASSDLISSRRSMDMLRLKHISTCAQTRDGGEGDWIGGPCRQNPRSKRRHPQRPNVSE